MNRVAEIVAALRAKNITVATAESCTGGMVAAAITDIPGSSDVLECGFVTYSNQSKIRLLGVKPQTLEAYGAVSEQVAREMAQGALRNSNAQLSVSITGIAGPGGSEHKPEGRVCFGLALKNSHIHTETQEFGAPGRAAVRELSRDYALELIVSALS